MGVLKEFRSVANTPLNITLEEIPKAEVAVGTTQIIENSPEKVDAAIGVSHLSVTQEGVDAAIGNSHLSIKVDAAIGNTQLSI